MFWPSTYPSSRKAWRNACHIGASSRMPMRGILDGCCARARLTLAASNRPAPPTRAVNSRRLMSDMAYFLSRSDHQQPTDCTVSLPHSGRQVLGADLNCSESGVGGRPLTCLQPWYIENSTLRLAGLAALRQLPIFP